MANKIIRTLRAVWTVFYHRFPNFVVGFLLTLGLVLGVRETYRTIAPGDWYLNYSSFDVQSVDERADVPFKACRDKVGNYDVDGTRNIYVIPDLNNPNERQVVGSYAIDATTTKDECVNAFITTRHFEHKAGYYQATTIFNFKVGKHDKQIQMESNIYRILPRREMSSQEIQMRIEELQLQIDELRALLAIQKTNQAPQPDENENNQNQSRLSHDNPQNQNDNNTAGENRGSGNPSQPPNEPEEPDEPAPSTLGRIIDNILNVFN